MVSANEWKMEPRILGRFSCTMWNQISFICYYKTNQVMAPDWILLAQWGYWRCIMSNTTQGFRRLGSLTESITEIYRGKNLKTFWFCTMSPHGVKELVMIIENSFTKWQEENWVCGSGISERSRADYRTKAQTNCTEFMVAISCNLCLFPHLCIQYLQASRSILGLKDFKQFGENTNNQHHIRLVMYQHVILCPPHIIIWGPF